MDSISRNIKKMVNSKAINNGIWLYVLQFFNTVIPLVTLPYITRILGAEKYGVFSIVLNIITYLQVLIEFGFGLSATRKVALSEESDNLSKLFTEVIISRVILFFISIFGVITYILISKRLSQENVCLIILAMGLCAYCFQQNWLFQGKQEMRFISFTNIIARAAVTICIFLFVEKPSDITLYCLLYSLSPIISNIFGTIIACRRYSLIFVRVTGKEILLTFKEGMYVFFTQLSSKVFGAVGITFLGIYASNYEVGIYSALNKIPYMLILAWSPVAQVIYPICSRRIMDSYSEGVKYINRLRRYCLFIFGGISFLIGVAAKIIIRIMLGQEYARYFYLIYPLLVWVLLGINNNFWGIQIMVGSGHDKEYGKCFQSGVMIAVIFNFTFIYFWKSLGAAFAPMLSEMALNVILAIQLRKIGRLNSERG